MPQVRLQGATIEYRELGPTDSAHPPVLFVHGILVDHRLWIGASQKALAGKGFAAYFPTGRWARTPSRSTGRHADPVGVAEMIHDFIAALDLRDVTLVGNDTGGGLCQLLVDAHPESVGRAGADQLRRLRQVPAVPVQRRVRDHAGPEVHQPAVRS